MARSVYPFLLILTVSLFSGQKVEVSTDIPLLHFDKIIHFFLFGLIATSVYRCFTTTEKKPYIGTFTAIVLTSIFGLLDEIHQGYTPGRSMDIADFWANVSGAFVATYAYRWWPFYRTLLEYKPGHNSG